METRSRSEPARPVEFSSEAKFKFLMPLSAPRGIAFTAAEALEDYGIDVLRVVAEDGAAPLVTKYDEPAATLRARRDPLNLMIEPVARKAGLTPTKLGRVVN
jgi:hypothetical protein